MNVGLIGQAVGLFAVTNIDDIVILALFFGQAVGRAGALRVIAGQYLGFTALLIAAVVGALGAGLLPEAAIPYLGLLPLLLGLRGATSAWRERNGDDRAEGPELRAAGPGMFAVAAVTVANGADNLGVYVPVFANSGTGALLSYVAVFLLLVAVWCAVGFTVANRPIVARALSRWGHIVLPITLIAVGLVILIEGGAFGL